MFLSKISTESAKVGVVGLGYVGLPLAMLACQSGYKVLGVDSDATKVAALLGGTSYISGISGSDLKKELLEGKLDVRQSYRALAQCDIIVICVPTPLAEDGSPDVSGLECAARGVAAILRSGQLIIVESTVAPGTTAGIVQPLLEAAGQIAGSDFALAYSPERIDPANAVYGLENTPKLVAGLTPCCRNTAVAFYESMGLAVVPVSTLAVAETAKLLENTYRDLNIAFINEMAQVCRQGGIDIWEVIEAAASKPFGFQPFYPGPGVGGHCIPVDSVYYAHWARKNGMPASLAEHARRVNAAMPAYISQLLAAELQRRGKCLSDSKVLLLGVTYKKDVGDTRESPALALLRVLAGQGVKVSFHDPFVPYVPLGSETLQRTPLDGQILSEQDAVVLAVHHSVFDITWLQQHSRLILDLVNGMAACTSEKIIRL